ncbi:hypothetical protein ACFRAM_24745 [Paenibacillus sp. NPDC056722]|uniref:hypothetical protein n=1 Tax=Paenibacillus sp. NPDC056722 TaxID=3345924 RepID=UPI0036D1ACB1
MNMIILLLSLLSPMLDASPQKPDSAAVLAPQAQVVSSLLYATRPTSYLDSFDSLAGVSLDTTQEELLLIKGTPLHIAQDPWLDCLEYQYEDMSAGVYAGQVIYVHVAPHQARLYGLLINGVKIEPEKDVLREVLGTPYFMAEDGDVYMRGNIALKIYRNPATGTWDGIDLFDGNSS